MGERIELPSLPEYTRSADPSGSLAIGEGALGRQDLSGKERKLPGVGIMGRGLVPSHTHTTGICGESSSWRRVMVVREWGGQSTATPTRFPTRGPEGCQTS